MKFLFLTCLVFTVAVFTRAQSPMMDFTKKPTTDPLPMGKKAPKLEFKDMSGKLISLEHLRGEVIVLNFWSIGCKGCEMERETLNWLSDSLKTQSVKFVSITPNDSGQLKEWFNKHPISYQIINNVDFTGIEGPSFFNYRCIPATVVIGKNGVVKYNQCKPIIGLNEAQAFAKLIMEE